VLDFINAAEPEVGTYHLYGRTLYEMTIGWETDPAAAHSPDSAGFARIWRAGRRSSFSRTLQSVSTQRTRLERSFDSGLVGRIKAEAAQDLNVSGADRAAWPSGLRKVAGVLDSS